jgi:hypothetical protein
LVAAGAATPEEQDFFKNHLDEGCLVCQEASMEFLEVNADWVNQLAPVAPPPAARERLLAAISQEAEIAPQRAKGYDSARGAATRGRRGAYKERAGGPIFWPWAIGWAFAAFFGILFFWNVQTHQREAGAISAQLQSLHLTVAEKEEAIRLMETRQTQTVALAGLDPAPDAAAKVFWNAEENTGLLVAFDLPALPTGKVYQLWAIQNAAPIDAGIFSLDQQGKGALKVKSLPDPQQPVTLFAITVEPAGGSPQPTGDLYLKGAV